MAFHINPESGEPGKCSATKGGCPFTTTKHFDSAGDAREAYEASMQTFDKVFKTDYAIADSWAIVEAAEAVYSIRSDEKLNEHLQLAVDAANEQEEYADDDAYESALDAAGIINEWAEADEAKRSLLAASAPKA